MKDPKPQITTSALWSKSPKRMVVRTKPDGDAWAESDGPGGYGVDEDE